LKDVEIRKEKKKESKKQRYLSRQKAKLEHYRMEKQIKLLKNKEI